MIKMTELTGLTVGGLIDLLKEVDPTIPVCSEAHYYPYIYKHDGLYNYNEGSSCDYLPKEGVTLIERHTEYSGCSNKWVELSFGINRHPTALLQSLSRLMIEDPIGLSSYLSGIATEQDALSTSMVQVSEPGTDMYASDFIRYESSVATGWATYTYPAGNVHQFRYRPFIEHFTGGYREYD